MIEVRCMGNPAGTDSRLKLQLAYHKREAERLEKELEAHRSCSPENPSANLLSDVLDLSPPCFHSRFLDSLDSAVLVTDTDGIIRYWNAGATRLYGWTKEEAVGRHVLDTTVPAENRQISDEVIEKLRRGETWQRDCIAIDKQGHCFWAQMKDTPVFDDDGQLIGIIGVSHDISERRAAEEKLRISERNLVRSQEIAKIGHWRFDIRTEEEEWSEQMYRIHG
ncbi:PAS domain S-box protein, partial [bacterium]|nr:PAS domain S-box protein [bacterium]